MSCKLDSGLIPSTVQLPSLKPNWHPASGTSLEFHCSPHRAVIKTPNPSSWCLLVPPDLYSDQKDSDLYFAEKKLALSKAQRSRAPLSPRSSFNKEMFHGSFHTCFKVLSKCFWTSGIQKFIDVLPPSFTSHWNGAQWRAFTAFSTIMCPLNYSVSVL